jgi:hypothetical protein
VRSNGKSRREMVDACAKTGSLGRGIRRCGAIAFVSPKNSLEGAAL